MTSEKSEELGGFPEIGTLRSVLDAYQSIIQGDSASLAEFAREKRLEPSALHRRIARFERAVQQRSDETLKVFDRDQGKKTLAIADHRVTQLMEDVAAIVEGYDRLAETRLRPLTVCIGASVTISNYLMSELLRDPRFRDDPAIDFDFSPSKPLRLREKAARGDCDFALVSVSPDFDPGRAIEKFTLKMGLLAPRGHWTERESFGWDKLGNEAEGYKDLMVLLRDEPDRYPMPPYPTGKFLPQLRVHRVTSASLSHALVMDKVAVTISLPQFFTHHQRENLHVIYHDDFGVVHIALIEGNPSKRPSKAKKKLLAEVQVKLLELMKNLGASGETFQPVEMNMYHVTRTTEPVWLRGNLTWRADGADLSGVYRLSYRGEQREFTIRGRTTESIDAVERRHIICNAFSDSDEFVLDATGQNYRSLLVGVWAGRSMWAQDSSTSFHGPVVIAPMRLTADQLQRIVSNYRAVNQLPELDLPGHIDNEPVNK